MVDLKKVFYSAKFYIRIDQQHFLVIQDLPLSDRKALVHVNSPQASQRLFQFKNAAQIPGSENLDPTAPLYNLSPVNKARYA